MVDPRLRFSAERKLEFAGNLRPEFAEDVETRVLENAVAHALSCWGESAVVLWVIGVAQDDGAGGSQPFRKIKHEIAIIALRHECVLQSMEKPASGVAVDHAVVARVLEKYRGVGEVLEKT